MEKGKKKEETKVNTKRTGNLPDSKWSGLILLLLFLAEDGVGSVDGGKLLSMVNLREGGAHSHEKKRAILLAESEN